MHGSREIAVFGGSESTPDDEVWGLALALGRGLAERGFAVLTGGYGGVMEAASRGAREAGGAAIGVTCAAFDRRPNGWLSGEVATADLWERTRVLVERAAGYVVVRGKAGTLAELTFVWALHRSGCLPRRPVILLGEPWPAFVEALRRGRLLDEVQDSITLLAGTPDEAVEALCRRLTPGTTGA